MVYLPKRETKREGLDLPFNLFLALFADAVPLY